MIRELSMSETMQLRHKNYFDHFMFELLGKIRPRRILLGLKCTALNEAYNLWLWRMRVTFGASGASKGFGFASTETRNQTFFGHPVCGFKYMFCICLCLWIYMYSFTLPRTNSGKRMFESNLRGLFSGQAEKLCQPWWASIIIWGCVGTVVYTV